MDLDEIRTKAAEMSIKINMDLVSAVIIHDGIRVVEQIGPLQYAKAIEEYIRTGVISPSLIIKKPYEAVRKP